MRQYEAVIKVMEDNGGYSSLSNLYEKVPRVQNCVWKTKTPFASIRRIVQDKRFFFKIKPGLWAMNSHRDNLPEEIILLMQSDEDTKKSKECNHTYYQGLLVELGNMKGYKTFVPHQDKNRKYIDKRLGDLVNLKDVLKFTFEDIIQKTRTIDVFWFNERRFPSHVFEIEHTTNFKNSPLKFLELQDFNIEMCIVSSLQRESEFEAAMQYAGFRPIVNRIKFMNYDQVSRMHTNFHEQMLMNKEGIVIT